MPPLQLTAQILQAIAARQQRGKRPGKFADKYVPLRKLLRTALVNEPDNSNAKYVRVRKFKKAYDGDGTAILDATTITRLPGQQPRLHQISVMAKPVGESGRLSEAPGIIVDCDCARHMYKWEYALHHHGAAMIQRSNGEPPLTQNPALKLACCKHVTRVLAFCSARKL